MGTDVSFDEPTYTPRPVDAGKKTGALTKAVIAAGFAKDQKGAQILLLIVAAACLVAAIAVAMAGGLIGGSVVPTPMVLE